VLKGFFIEGCQQGRAIGCGTNGGTAKENVEVSDEQQAMLNIKMLSDAKA
jgi:hypothetical protein